jgi:hypothetical protein
MQHNLTILPNWTFEIEKSLILSYILSILSSISVIPKSSIYLKNISKILVFAILLFVLLEIILVNGICLLDESLLDYFAKYLIKFFGFDLIVVDFID